VSDPGNFGTVIGQGSLLEGTLLIDHGIRVDGTFRGRVTTPTDVAGQRRRRGGVRPCRGGSRRDTWHRGRDDSRPHWVRIGATARLNGSIETPRLIVEEGAMIVNR